MPSKSATAGHAAFIGDLAPVIQAELTMTQTIL
jgi:hypothetical protein